MLTFGADLLLVEQDTSYDPTRGLSQVLVYEGTPTAIQNAFAGITDPYFSKRMGNRDRPKWTLTVQFPDELNYQTIWELHGNDEQKSIYEHTRVIATGIGTQNIHLLRDYFKSKEETDPMPDFTGPNASDAKEAWRLLKKETTHFFKPQYVLRSRTMGTLNGFVGAQFNPNSVGLVFTQGSLLPGGAFDLGLPAPIVTYLEQIEAEPTADSPDNNYRWGWLFKTPSITGLPGGKFELRQEWWLENWSTLLYDAGVP